MVLRVEPGKSQQQLRTMMPVPVHRHRPHALRRRYLPHRSKPCRFPGNSGRICAPHGFRKDISAAVQHNLFPPTRSVSAAAVFNITSPPRAVQKIRCTQSGHAPRRRTGIRLRARRSAGVRLPCAAPARMIRQSSRSAGIAGNSPSTNTGAQSE